MMKPLILFILIAVSALFSQSIYAQAIEPTNDTWYVWIDITIPVEGVETRLISDEPMEITCCLQSAKYRKFVKKAAKWINTNVSSDFTKELELTKIQDSSLANEMIDKAKQAANTRILDYSATCK